jgi:hypothetical protein
MSLLFDARQVEELVVSLFRAAGLDPTCGADGVSASGHCVRCGYRVDWVDSAVICPPGFLDSILRERSRDAVRECSEGSYPTAWVEQYPGWSPYCLRCSTMARMRAAETGWSCACCGATAERIVPEVGSL